jgi:hypothetical protein
MAIPEHHRTNFGTLQTAFDSRDVVLVECTSTKTGEPVYMLCIAYRDGDDRYVLRPFAKLMEDPFEEVDPPGLNQPRVPDRALGESP